MKLVNLTSHPIGFVVANGATPTIPPSGHIARVSRLGPGTTTTVDGLPVPVVTPAPWGPVTGLPEPVEGTLYVVSLLVLEHAEGRDDLVAPCTSPEHYPVRDAEGRIVAVRCLVAALRNTSEEGR